MDQLEGLAHGMTVSCIQASMLPLHFCFTIMTVGQGGPPAVRVCIMSISTSGGLPPNIVDVLVDGRPVAFFGRFHYTFIGQVNGSDCAAGTRATRVRLCGYNNFQSFFFTEIF